MTVHAFSGEKDAVPSWVRCLRENLQRAGHELDLETQDPSRLSHRERECILPGLWELYVSLIVEIPVFRTWGLKERGEMEVRVRVLASQVSLLRH